MTKKIHDVTCGSRTIWFNKNHPAAIYCDVRDEECTGVWKSTNRDSERTCIVHPDVLCDFTDLPFPDNSFVLVVFDPPHLRRVGENSWMRKKYGKLGENWREMLHAGFRECMRVLKPDGVLIFKWAETQIPAADVWAAIGERPLFGHHSGKRSQCRELPCPYNGACSQRKVWERLKAYEDKAKTPEEVLPKDKADEIALKLMRLADLESLCSYTRLRELAEADKDGRLVVLPCGGQFKEVKQNGN